MIELLTEDEVRQFIDHIFIVKQLPCAVFYESRFCLMCVSSMCNSTHCCIVDFVIFSRTIKYVIIILLLCYYDVYKGTHTYSGKSL